MTALQAVAGAAACGVAVHILLKHQRHRCLPRSFRRGRFGTKRLERSEGAHVERDGYSSKKIQIDDLDAIIIGSGIGGLTCAGLLSRAGWRCLVLEQHYVAGGCMHMFEEHGFEFDTGLHYVGNIHRRQKYLDLVCSVPVDWDQMGTVADGFAYDEVVVGPNGCETSVLFPAGREALMASLEASFPNQISVVKRWLDRLAKINKDADMFFDFKLVRPKCLARLLNRFISASFFRGLRRGAVDEAKEIIPDARLRAVLLGQFGNYCTKPGEALAFAHATVHLHYHAGGWYPRGGSKAIARKIIPTIERAGGRVLVRKAVKQIIIEKGRACGVIMENGDRIHAPYVISACGALNTWGKLVPAASVPRAISAKLAETGPSATIMYCFIGLDSSDLDLPSRNIWRWPTDDDYDLDKMIQRFHDDPEHAPVPLFCGFPSSKDKAFSEHFPGKATAVLLCIGKYEWFSQWEGTKWGKRGKAYEEFKHMLTDRIVNEGLYHMWPQTKGHVVYTALGTSLTYNHFLGSVRGEAYGLDCKPARFVENDWLRPESPLPGLYLTGQDVACFGIAGALMSGVLTSMAVLGYGSVLDIASGRNIVEDLWHLDAQEESEYSTASRKHFARAYPTCK